MNKNTTYILIAIVIAVLIALFVMPQKEAPVVTSDVPVTADPTNGMTEETATGDMAEPADHMPDMPAAAEEGMEVDGVPTGTEVTGEPTDTMGTTPAPETTDTMEQPADAMPNEDQAPAAQ